MMMARGESGRHDGRRNVDSRRMYIARPRPSSNFQDPHFESLPVTHLCNPAEKPCAFCHVSEIEKRRAK